MSLCDLRASAVRKQGRLTAETRRTQRTRFRGSMREVSFRGILTPQRDEAIAPYPRFMEAGEMLAADWPTYVATYFAR